MSAESNGQFGNVLKIQQTGFAHSLSVGWEEVIKGNRKAFV